MIKTLNEAGKEVLEFPRCTVCLEDLKVKGTQMPCGHLFDQECVTTWLKEHN